MYWRVIAAIVLFLGLVGWRVLTPPPACKPPGPKIADSMLIHGCP